MTCEVVSVDLKEIDDERSRMMNESMNGRGYDFWNERHRADCGWGTGWEKHLVCGIEGLENGPGGTLNAMASVSGPCVVSMV